MKIKYGRKFCHGEDSYELKLFDTLEQAQNEGYGYGPVYEVVGVHKPRIETRKFWVKEEFK